MLQVLTSDYAYQVLLHLRKVSSSVDILSYVVNFNIYKRSDKANLIFSALKSLPFPHSAIRFILDKPRLHKPNYNCNKFSVRRFQEAHFNVRYLHSGDTQHAKLIILDQKLAIFGSHNFTTKSVISNYDISLLLDDPALLTYFIAYFNRLWHDSIEA